MDDVDVGFLARILAVKGLKQRVVTREGVGGDLKPMLECLRDGTTVAFVVAPLDPDELERALPKVVEVFAADELVHVTEGYWFLGEPSAYQHGDLARWFADGDPNVAEGVFVADYRRHDSTVLSAFLGYTYKGRTVEWLAPIPLPDGLMAGGRFPDVIMTALTAEQGEPWSWDEAAAELEALGLRPYRILETAGRNDPCPCGSGRKFKFCHG